jgi:hypothetical protein
MKKGKSTKLNGYKDFKITYGTVDSRNLKSIYINLQTWAEPKKTIEYPQRSINILSREIKHSILDGINKDLFHDKFIVDLDLRSSGIQINKKSFLNLECFIYLKNPIQDFKSNEIKLEVKKITDLIILKNFKRNENYSFHLTKKETIEV